MTDREPTHGRDHAVAGVQHGREGPFRRLQVEVGVRARRGEPLAQIDHEVIAPSSLSEDDKSALAQAMIEGPNSREKVDTDDTDDPPPQPANRREST